MNDNEKWILLQLRKVIIEMDNIINETTDAEEWVTTPASALLQIESVSPCLQIASNRLRDAKRQYKEL